MRTRTTTRTILKGVRMKSRTGNGNLSRLVWIGSAVAWVCLSQLSVFAMEQPAEKKSPASAPAGGVPRSFETPQQAADALVEAAEKFDVAALTRIFGPDGNDIIFSGEFAQD